MGEPTGHPQCGFLMPPVTQPRSLVETRLFCSVLLHMCWDLPWATLLWLLLYKRAELVTLPLCLKCFSSLCLFSLGEAGGS